MSDTSEKTIPADVNALNGSNSANSLPNESAPASSVDKGIEKQVTDGVEDYNTSKLRSDVWKHFEKKKIKGDQRAICNYCCTSLTAVATSGTSHLRLHYKRCLKKLPQQDLRQMVLKANQKKADGKVLLKNAYSFSEDVSRVELAKMIVLHEYPLSMVEHEGFRDYSSSLQPLFKVPSRNTIGADIMKMYADKMTTLSTFLETVKGRISVTTDMWTSDHQTKGYMAITAHFIDDSWILQKRIIRFRYVPAPHDKETISGYLMDCLMDWNIDRKPCTITVDNCSVNDGVVELISDRIGSGGLLLDGAFLHMRCAAHILNLVVQDGMSFYGKQIEKIRETVLYWTATPKRTERFEEAARQLRISCTRKLSMDVKTRWNSTFLMLESAFPYKDVFPRLKQREPKYKSLPSEEDWKIAFDLCERLKLFHEVTKLFSGTKYPTSNLFFTQICEIKLALESWAVEDGQVSQMAVVMLEKFNKYWDMINGIMGVASLLDPRYKTCMLEYYFKQLYGEEKTVSEVKKIVNICSDLLDEYERKKVEQNDKTSSSSAQTNVISASIDDHMAKYAMFVSSKRSKRASFKSELDHYLDDDVLPMTKDFDVLEWWKSNGIKYPFLQAIARDILAIPVTSVASESAFSMGGRLLSPHRNRLHPNTVEALACCQNWLWSEKASKLSLQSLPPPFILFNDDEESDLQEHIFEVNICEVID